MGEKTQMSETSTAAKRARTDETMRLPFRATTASAASALTDCAQLPNNVMMPWVHLFQL